MDKQERQERKKKLSEIELSLVSGMFVAIAVNVGTQSFFEIIEHGSRVHSKYWFLLSLAIMVVLFFFSLLSCILKNFNYLHNATDEEFDVRMKLCVRCEITSTIRKIINPVCVAMLITVIWVVGSFIVTQIKL